MQAYFFDFYTKVPNLVWWGVAGILTGLSLISPWCWVLVFPGLFLQLWLLRRRTCSFRHMFIGAWFAGLVHMLISLSWGWSVVPLDWLGVSTQWIQSGVIAVAWILSAVTIGAGYGLVLAVAKYAVRDHWSLFVLFPFAVLGGEILGRLFFSLGTVGQDSGLNIAFGFGHVGYALIEHSLLRMGGLFAGVYGLTFLCGVVVSGFYTGLLLLHRRTQKMVFVVSVLLLLGIGVLDMPISDSMSAPADVAIVSTQFSMEFNRSPGAAEVVDAVHKQAFMQALDEGYSTVIFPEDARFLSSLEEGELDRLLEYVSEPVTIIDSARGERDGKTVLHAVVYDGVSGKTYTYDKQYLVPFGEQIPLVPSLLLRSVGLGGVVDTLQQSFGYRVGLARDDVYVPEYLPSVLFCYESIVPYMMRALTHNPVPYMAHVVSHAWFDDPSGILNNQLSAMLRVQAIWNGVSIIQASNEAPSAVYLSSGQMFLAPVPEGDTLYRIDGARNLVDR